MNKPYKIIVNVPGKKDAVEFSLDEEMLNKLEPMLNSKKIVKIYDEYINTAYIVMITPDYDAITRENVRLQQEEESRRIAEKSELTNREDGAEKMKEIRKKFLEKFKV